jgi:arylsulfatase A-like enzyme
MLKPMTRWMLVLVFGLWGALNGAPRPNIIVFMVDDYDKYETSVYGGKALTPNLDRMAREGITFENAHVTSTVCTPSRYTFLTGRYAGSAYSANFLELFPKGQQSLPAFNVRLEPDNHNVAAVLAKAGYATGMVGKFHVGPSLSDSKFREKYGLHEVKKNVPFTEALNRKKYENEKGYRKAVKDFGFTWAKNIYWDNTKAPFQSHNPEWTAAAAAEFIERHKKGPFYMHYCTTLLHGPNGSWHKSLDKPRVTGEGIIKEDLNVLPPRASVMKRIEAAGLTSDQAGYLWMDDSLGLILDKLDELKLTKNTLVLFIADHGSSNKGSLYKAKGTEVPCIMRWPAGMKAGVRSQELIQNTDFVPTWFELAGVKKPATYQVDGVSLRALFQEPHKPVRKHVYAEIGAARSIKTKTHSYIALRYTREQIAGVKESHHRYLKSLTGLSGGVSRSIATHPRAYTGDQLYDLKRDSDAQKNLAGYPRHDRTLRELKQTLTTELKRFPDRPYGEFVSGGNAVPGDGYDEVFETLRKAAADKKKKK